MFSAKQAYLKKSIECGEMYISYTVFLPRHHSAVCLKAILQEPITIRYFDIPASLHEIYGVVVEFRESAVRAVRGL